MKNAGQLLEIARDIIEAEEYCFLITLDASGQPNARLVTHFKPDEALVLWFGTSPQSRKVHELQRDPRMTVAFHHPGELAFLTLKGTGAIEEDRSLRRKMWHAGWDIFYPGGPDGPNYVLIQFTPTELELMSFGRGVLPPPYGMKTADLVRSGKGWVLKSG